MSNEINQHGTRQSVTKVKKISPVWDFRLSFAKGVTH